MESEMDQEKELPKRKPTRLKHFDYSTTGAYFITICTEGRQKVLSRIVGGDVLDTPKSVELLPHENVGGDVPDAPKSVELLPHENVGGDVLDAPKSVELLPHGKIADKYINRMNEFYEHIAVDRYVIMPNHIHIMLWVKGTENGPSRTPVPTLQNSVPSQFVSTFKRFCNKEYGDNIWQRHCNDHIIRNREDYEEHVKYVYENPMRWYYDELYAEE